MGNLLVFDVTEPSLIRSKGIQDGGQPIIFSENISINKADMKNRK